MESGAARVDRVLDRQLGETVLRLMPGAVHVAAPPAVLTTVLGSCVAVCARDPGTGVGGMNHFMLPEAGRGPGGGADGGRYGPEAMARLLEDIRRHGGATRELEVKVFGGGRIFDGMGDVGRSNVEFVRGWLRDARITIAAEDTGGAHPRKVLYFVESGRVLLRRLRPLHARAIAAEEQRFSREFEP